jgi:hypothetical protein
MNAINWKISDHDRDLIDKIVKRVVGMYSYPLENPLAKPRSSYTADQQRKLYMDLQAVHGNGCPLDLAALLAGSPWEFTHDIAGIGEHIDRTTGKLLNCFVPRFAVRSLQPEAAQT